MVKADQVHDIMGQFTIGDGEKIVIDQFKSRDSHLVDLITGKKYLDCSSQFASQALGWNHSKLYQKAVGHLMFAALHKFANPDYYSVDLAKFTKKFAEITPDFKYHFYVEGGSLAVENAVKAAFDWKAQRLNLTERQANNLNLIHLKQAFHGRGGYTLSMTNTVHNKVALFPKFDWTRAVNPKIGFPFNKFEIEEAEAESIDQMRQAIKQRPTAAIVLEPIQGEGGDNHFRPEYFAYLRQLADENDVMLIFDEVQTGMGMTGKMWAYEHYGVVPDMICFGKKSQVCGFASTARIDSVPTNVFKTSSRINSTWGGNIVDMVRATYIIEIMQEDNLLQNAASVGNYFLEKLRELPRITHARGKGLFLAFDLESVAARNDVLNKMSQDMLVLPCGERSIRLRPHLTFTKADADEAVKIISAAIK